MAAWRRAGQLDSGDTCTAGNVDGTVFGGNVDGLTMPVWKLEIHVDHIEARPQALFLVEKRGS